jgi:hypothetical protein
MCEEKRIWRFSLTFLSFGQAKENKKRNPLFLSKSHNISTIIYIFEIQILQ